MAPLVEPGTIVGEADAPGGGGGRVRVVAPGTTDPASAVAAIPLDGPDEAFISSGTWSLMGIESRVPFANATARRLNFSNEGGLERRYRVLKNIMGLWLVQRIRQESGCPDHATLVDAARAAQPWRSLVHPDDPRFLNPPSMTAAIRDFCAETGQPVPEGLGWLARCASALSGSDGGQRTSDGPAAVREGEDTVMTRHPTAEKAYVLAREAFAAIGVDTEAALARVDRIPISLHCWQGDDVRGFENPQGPLTGGIQATGNYPGGARNADELRADVEVAMAQIPGPKRFHLHAIYLETNRPVDRSEIKPEHFQRWVEWAKQRGLGLDFNPTCFSHPKSEQNMTLSHPDPAIRRFWIDHCKASRGVSAHFGKSLGTPSIMNIWIPDGSKDQPYDRFGPRRRLIEALDEVIAIPIPREIHRDAVQGTR